jgi:GntR family transcriptional repressor for pyruvate dehydrogenase complex
MDINPISMKRIYQSIIEQFVGLISNEKLVVGQKLPSERVLAEKFGVSRASIREAFSAMEIIGLIEVRPGEGTFVSDLNIAPFINTIAPLFLKNSSLEDDLLEFRKMLELEAVKLAAEKADAGKTGIMEKPLSIMKNAIENNDAALGAEADISFHKALFTLSGNVILMKASEYVGFIFEASVKLNRDRILVDSRNSEILYQQHKQIYHAVCKKDAASAAEIMSRHLDFVKQINQIY